MIEKPSAVRLPSRWVGDPISLLGYVGIVAALFLCPRAVHADEIGKDRFITEYLESVPRLKTAYDRIRVSGTWKKEISREVNPRPPLPDPRPPTEFFFVRSGGREKLYFDRLAHVPRDPKEPPTGPERFQPFGRVLVSAGEKSFVLRREGDNPAYSIEYTSMGGSMTSLLDSFKYEVAGSPFTLVNVDVAKMLSSNSFRVESVSSLANGGRNLYKATFSYRPQGERLKEMKGWLAVDPAHSWVLDEYDVQVTHDVKNPHAVDVHAHTEYDFSGQVPKPTKIESKSVSQTKERGTSSVLFETTAWEFTDAPAEEFTLAAYGLGDLAVPRKANATSTGAPKRSAIGSQYWILPAVIGVVSLALAFLVRKLTAARSATSQ